MELKYLNLYVYCSSNIYFSLNFSKLFSPMLNINSQCQKTFYIMKDCGSWITSTWFRFHVAASLAGPGSGGHAQRCMCYAAPSSHALSLHALHLFPLLSQKAPPNSQWKTQLPLFLPLPALPPTQTSLHLTSHRFLPPLSIDSAGKGSLFFTELQAPSSL